MESQSPMEPNNKGILELQSCSDDETNSLHNLFHWQMKDYEVFPSTCNFLEAMTLNEEQPMKNDFGKLDSLCVWDAIHGWQKMTVAMEVSDFVEECKVMNDMSQSTKSKIFNLERRDIGHIITESKIFTIFLNFVTYIHTYRYIHTYIHTYTYRYTHTHTHIHVYMLL